MLLASSGERPGLLLGISLYNAPDRAAGRSDLALNVSSAKVRNSALKSYPAGHVEF